MINISDGLKAQMKRLQDTGSFSVNMIQKQELAKLTKEIGCRELVNLDCGTCVRNAMYDVKNFAEQYKTKPLLQFKGVKSPAEMSYQEMRKACKDRNIPTGRNPKKNELIKLLS